MATVESSQRYSVHEHLGAVPLVDWHAAGIMGLIIDKDNTASSYHQSEPLDHIVRGLQDQDIAHLFPWLAVVSNSRKGAHVQDFGLQLEDALQVKVYTFFVGQGYPKKPNPYMGRLVARKFGLEYGQMAVIGDRRIIDVRFGLRLGAGAVALCRKQGQGDAFGVGVLRVLEPGLVLADRKRGRAIVNESPKNFQSRT